MEFLAFNNNFYPKSLKIVYDGECPFCKRYTAISTLTKKIETVELINARENSLEKDFIIESGYDLSEGMVLIVDDETILYGPDAMFGLSVWSDNNSFLSRFIAGCLKNRTLNRYIYPVLKLGRRIALFLLNKSHRI